MKGEQLANMKLLCPGERQVFRERVKPASMERLLLCFAELMAACPSSWLVKHQVRSEAGHQSLNLDQSRSAGSKTHLYLVLIENSVAATQAIKY